MWPSEFDKVRYVGPRGYLPSRDFAAASEFYSALGFVQQYRDDGWMILARGDLVLEFCSLLRLIAKPQQRHSARASTASAGEFRPGAADGTPRARSTLKSPSPLGLERLFECRRSNAVDDYTRRGPRRPRPQADGVAPEVGAGEMTRRDTHDLDHRRGEPLVMRAGGCRSTPTALRRRAAQGRRSTVSQPRRSRARHRTRRRTPSDGWP